MAFQDVNVSKTRKATEIEVGGNLTGYVVRFEQGKAFEGQKPSQNIVMQDKETGEQYLLFTAGNLKYLITDGKIAIGALTQIVRLPDEKVKGMKASKFQVLQDADDTISDAVFAEISSTTQTAANSAVVRNSAESSIKNHAAKLQSAMRKQ